MKKILVFTIAALFAVSGMAQEKKKGRSAEQRAEKITNKMKEKLNLTDEQVVKIKAINLEAAQQKDTLKAEAKAERKEKVKAIETDRDTKIKAVLTEEQKAEYEKMKEKGKEKVKKHRKDKKAEATEEDDE
ncbi:MAG: hypothetical protein F9K23_03865 [Bacteroidetes bacterium]|nr:MAG: hypothetical protein F9K23_03865 [Bacteroidota bacterium]